ncbi:N-glycosidase [Ditylenchus destructor]|uniref:N-glycosidase n=1 Tax=Ditylenchus destructor TaxID=166010 RepID=A0AAD4MWB0_9BILA|nr:N-glycosidase [Ditylenchus destructor]
MARRICMSYPAGQEAVSFYNDRSIFSNFFTRPNLFTIESQSFVSSLQYYESVKAKILGFDDIEFKIKYTTDPKEIKDLGNFVERMAEKEKVCVWQTHKDAVMWKALCSKFGQNHDLLEALVSTGKMLLVAANPYDSYWGAGLHKNSSEIRDKRNWKLNKVGAMLEEIRDGEIEKRVLRERLEGIVETSVTECLDDLSRQYKFGCRDWKNCDFDRCR